MSCYFSDPYYDTPAFHVKYLLCPNVLNLNHCKINKIDMILIKKKKEEEFKLLVWSLLNEKLDPLSYNLNSTVLNQLSNQEIQIVFWASLEMQW